MYCDSCIKAIFARLMNGKYAICELQPQRFRAFSENATLRHRIVIWVEYEGWVPQILCIIQDGIILTFTVAQVAAVAIK